MSLSDAERKEIENKKDFTLKEILQEEAIAEQKRMRAETQRIRQEQRQRGRDDNALDWDGRPYFNKQTGDEKNPILPGKIETHANNLIGKEFSGYNDWAVAMQALLSGALELNKALWDDQIFYYSDIVLPVCSAIGDAVWELTTRPSNVKDSELSQISFRASVDENGSIQAEVSKDNKVDPKLRYYFQQGINEWAKLQGYTSSRSKPGLQNNAGTKMTAEKFKELNEDSDSSLNSFLSNRLGLKIEYCGLSPAAPKP